MEIDGITLHIRTSTRARNLRVSVYPDGKVIVTHPVKMPLSLVTKFVSSKSGWIKAKVSRTKNNPLPIVPKERLTKEKYAVYKKEALQLVQTRLEHFNEIYNHTWKSITIKNQKTRWGSCSKRGNLNFNYKILFLTSAQQDYLVVHELCHLKEMNHSQQFWDLVRITVPNYLELRKSMRRFSL